MTTLILEQAREEMRRRLLAGETLEMMGASGVPYTYGPRQVLQEAVSLLPNPHFTLCLAMDDESSPDMKRTALEAINETVRDSLFDWLRAMDKKGE